MIEEVGRLGRETLVLLRIRRDYHLDRFLPQLPGDLGHAQIEERAPVSLDVRREHVASIFPESSLSPKLARAIARETGAAAGLTLYGDTLGPAGSGAELQ